MKIHELLNVPRQRHGVAWLKDALQTALELELSTLPPYLTALWSIVTPSGDVYDLIRSVVFEEMLHFGLACNLLNTIGGEPQIAHWKAVPKYPGPLPGDVRPGLIVPLTGLTRRLVHEVFMEIEYPEGGPIPHHHRSISSPTIGAFYSAIADAFEMNASAIKGTRQLESDRPVPVFPINTLGDALKAIIEIKEQGEGTWKSPLAARSRDELAHYYKFGEIYHGHKFVKHSAHDWEYDGDPIDFPTVHPVAQVPAEGYPEWPDAETFNQKYTDLLHLLQKAWSDGDQRVLGQAIGTMGPLRQAALTLMTTPIDGGGYTYGPPFRFLRDR